MKLNLNSRVSEFSTLLLNLVVSNYEKHDYDVETGLDILYSQLFNLRDSNKNLYIVGNGGSAGVAAHAVTDFFNVGKIRAFTLHESSLLTCMANDFGYENATARLLSQVLNPGDFVIVISSSGASENMKRAALNSRAKGAFVLTLSGFSQDNPLRSLGDMNIWLNSNDYGFVEIGHQFVLHNLADRFNEKLKD
jgi:D-sedoheptulose 7-phosphate isomerase